MPKDGKRKKHYHLKWFSKKVGKGLYKWTSMGYKLVLCKRKNCSNAPR